MKKVLFALIFSGLLAFSSLSPMTASAFEDTYLRDGLLVNNTTMLPMRSIFETFDSEVKWDGATRTVTAVNADHTIVLKIDSDVVYVDGAQKRLPQKVIIFNDLTMVPVRFVSETLGAEVEWNDKYKEAIIKKGSEVYTIRTFPPEGYQVDETGVAYKEIKIQAMELYKEYEAMYERVVALGKDPSAAEWNAFHNEFVDLYNNVWSFYYIDSLYIDDYPHVESGAMVQYQILDFVHLIDRHVDGDAAIAPYYDQQYVDYKQGISQALEEMKEDIDFRIIPVN